MNSGRILNFSGRELCPNCEEPLSRSEWRKKQHLDQCKPEAPLPPRPPVVERYRYRGFDA